MDARPDPDTDPPEASAGPLRGWWAAACRLDPRSLAMLRVLLGAILAVDAILRSTSMATTLAPDGFLPPDLTRRFVGQPWSWSLLFLHDSAWWGAAGLALEGAAGCLLAAGFATPVVTTVAWVAVVSVVRRTAPMTNAGDVFLACLLFWGQFVPWGSTWSIDARWRGGVAPRVVRGLGPAALLVQVAAVYVSAGLGKWNDTWWSGDALSYALSVHDHGTPLGAIVAASGMPARVLSWATLLLECAGPPLLLVPRARVPLVVTFLLFHLAIALTMDVCLFPWVGIAAWIGLLPASFWDRIRPGSGGRGTVTAPRSVPGKAVCVAALVVATAAFLDTHGPWQATVLPAGARAVVQLTFLEQDWRVFGEIRRQRQWVYALAELADGDRVDLLRPDRPPETVLPAGGFHAVGDQRLQKLLWEIPKPDRRPFAPHVAEVLARRWNRVHPAARHVVSLELRGARRLDTPEPGVIQDVLLASWPARSASGRGALERFLRESEGQAPLPETGTTPRE